MELKTFKCGHSEKLALVGLVDQKDGTKAKIYTDEKGRKRRARSKCYNCYMAELREKRGTKPRCESTAPIIKSAVRAERIAAEHFRCAGWVVEHGHGAGPDLLIWLPDDPQNKRSVEVKQAFRATRCWQVSFVKEKRRGDDFVAIVLPNTRVHVEKMTEHLSKCGNYGNRSVTAIVKEIGLNEV